MNDRNDIDFTEDRELIESVRKALDVGEVPERLRVAVHNAAERQVFENHRHSFSRMSRWMSGLTTTAAAAIICMYSANQYFGRQHVGHDELQRLDRIMDLVSLDYAEETAEDGGVQPLQSTDAPTLDSVTERYDRMSSFYDDEDYYL